MRSIRKYPRTRHVTGSRLQPGDEDLSQVPFSALAGRHLVVEEKIDRIQSFLSNEYRDLSEELQTLKKNFLSLEVMFYVLLGVSLFHLVVDFL